MHFKEKNLSWSELRCIFVIWTFTHTHSDLHDLTPDSNVRMHTHTYAHKLTRPHTLVKCACAYAFPHVRLYTHGPPSIRMCVYVFTRTHIDSRDLTLESSVRVRIHFLMYVHTHTTSHPIQMCIYTFPHTHTNSPRSKCAYTYSHIRTQTHPIQISVYVSARVHSYAHKPTRPHTRSKCDINTFTHTPTRPHTPSHPTQTPVKVQLERPICWLEITNELRLEIPTQPRPPSWLQFAISSAGARDWARPNQSRNERCHTMIDCQSANMTRL